MEPVDAAERYERGVTLRKAGLFKLAMEELRQAAAYPAYALKAYAQIGLCHQSTGRYEEAISAFRRALTCSSASIRETVQILYVLGRTLEMRGRIAETLEVYRWIRREDPSYRDVEDRIQQLSARRLASTVARPSHPTWMEGVLRSWQGLLRSSRE
jgi:tetratricopeptide (TPR) repeat protein